MKYTISGRCGHCGQTVTAYSDTPMRIHCICPKCGCNVLLTQVEENK